MATHKVLTVAVAPHEAGDPGWRVRHANETIQTVVLAYFAADSKGEPIQAEDGTFEVHAVSWDTLDTLRTILTDHEGLRIVSEREAPGTGVIIAKS